MIDLALDLVSGGQSVNWVSAGVYALVFIIATLLLVPASPLTLIAGFLFGPVWGTALVSGVGIISASLAFLIGRTIARPTVKKLVEKHPRLAVFDVAVSLQGFRILLLLRLASIVPFAPVNYTLGTSQMRFTDFMLASWLGLLPGTFLYVYLGALVTDIHQLVMAPPTLQHFGSGLYWGGIIGIFAILVAVVITARRALNQALRQEHISTRHSH